MGLLGDYFLKMLPYSEFWFDSGHTFVRQFPPEIYTFSTRSRTSDFEVDSRSWRRLGVQEIVFSLEDDFRKILRIFGVCLV